MNQNISTKERIARLFSLAWLLILSTCLVAIAPEAFAQSDTEAQLLKVLTKDLPLAMVQADSLALTEVFSENYEKIDDLGNWSNREIEIGDILSSEIRPDSIIVEITRLTMLGSIHAQAVTRSVEVNNKIDPKTTVRYWSSHILQKAGDSWKIRSSHISGRKVALRIREPMDKF